MKEFSHSYGSEQASFNSIIEEVSNAIEKYSILKISGFEYLKLEPDFTGLLSRILSLKLASDPMAREELYQLISDTFSKSPSAVMAAHRDLLAHYSRDPACVSIINPFLFFKGFHAVQTYRVANLLWKQGREILALWLQSESSERFGVDIHPEAEIGAGLMLDHGSGVVIGSTAIVEDDVSIMHNVTLGGSGKHIGKRHPIIKSGALISSGAKILGRIVIGECAKVGAGSVVLSDVPAHRTAVGIPARIVKGSMNKNPSLDMDHTIR
jgi:serine O-acetyltransferase